jgi:hypothetical protein
VEHENDFAINLTKAQIEQFPALDVQVLEDKKRFEEYDRSYRSSWTQPTETRKPVTNTRLTSFQEEIARNRANICERSGVSAAGTESRRKVG